MDGENQLLVPNEPVEFEKDKFEHKSKHIGTIINHFNFTMLRKQFVWGDPSRTNRSHYPKRTSTKLFVRHQVRA